SLQRVRDACGVRGHTEAQIPVRRVARVRDASREVEIQRLERAPAELRIEGAVTVAVVLAAVGSDADAARVEPAHAERAAIARVAGPGVRGEISRAVRAVFGARAQAWRPLPAAGDDVDDAGQRVAAPQRALRSAHDLDPLDPGNGELAEVEL